MVFSLSILICHTDNPMRNTMLKALELEFDKQIRDNGLEGKVEILIDSEPGSIGAKRNRLLDKAWGTYIAFFDDDDFPFPNYLKRIFEGINEGVDACSLTGMITFDGENPEYFCHSKVYKEYKTKSTEGFYDAINAPYHTGKFSLYIANDGCNSVDAFGKREPIKYERFHNHLNTIKKDIAKQFKFPDTNHGEDTDWATQLFKSGLIKTEHWIDEPIYHYKFVSKKNY